MLSRLPSFAFVSLLLATGCADEGRACLPGDVSCLLENGGGGKADGFAQVPDCRDFDLQEMIDAKHDLSPDYQCVVSEGLSRSSQPDAQWIDSLTRPDIREVPFKSVVNLRGERGSNWEDPFVRDAGMTPLNIPVPDMHAPTHEQVIQFLDFVTDEANQPVLVHCKAGQGRTGTFVTIYRMFVQGWAPVDAMSEAHDFNVSPEQATFLEELATEIGSPELEKYLGAAGSALIDQDP